MKFAASNEPRTCVWCGRRLRERVQSTYARVPRAKSPCCGAPLEKGDSLTYCAKCGVYVDPMKRKLAGRQRSGSFGLDDCFDTKSCQAKFGSIMAALGHRLHPRKAS